VTAISIEEQVQAIMFGTEFGDTTLKNAMAKELHDRLKEAEEKGRPLRVYAGYDPSKPDLHLGHSISMRKLRQFQDFGHDVTFLVGTFTAQVGDASDKTTGRPRLDEARVLKAANSYAEQAFTILDRARTKIAYNHEWLSKLTMSDVVSLASHFTVQQFLVRDNFQKRIEANNPVGLHEFMYALLQGYDAVHLRADVQLGATEQLFNIMAGRKLQPTFGQKPCVCVTFPILVGTDGKMRMSKSAGNYVGLADPAEEQYGKVMSISDETMVEWLKYVTRWPVERIESSIRDLRAGELHPMELKKALAWEVAATYHGDSAADEAASRFRAVHQEKGLPEELVLVKVARGAKITDVLTKVEGVGSKSQARRLIEGGGVRLDGAVVKDFELIVDADCVLQVGKRRFCRVVIEP